MAFYEGIDEEIYEGGDHYVPMQQFRLNKFVPTVKTTPVTSPTSTSYGIPRIYPYGGGGDGEYQGGGKWGNLDLSKEKTFNKQVWEVGGPANQYGGWVDKEVTGYYNPKTGHYQTFEGKNINHLGLEVPTIAGMIFDKDFGKGPKPGDIKGTFTDGWDSGWENIKEGWDEEKDKWSGILGINKAKAFFKGKKDKELTVGPEYHTTDVTQTDTKGGGEFADDSHGDDWQKTFSGGAAGGEFDTTSSNAGTSEGWSGADWGSGTDEYGSLAKGGRVGFENGGSGIVGWLKSKMGIESETNPTMFGTQDSLFNRGAIDQLENAIKSYEAAMYMGELDEEQLADYELKLAQLEALKEGAENKADGGRVGFFKGALADTKEGKAMSPGTTTSGDFRDDGGQGDGGNTVVVPKTNYINIKPDIFREDPYVNINVMSPLEMAKLQATIGYRDIFDNDDLSVEGDLTTNIGPIDTRTQFTDDGIGNTDINWGNFSTTIDPNKNIQNIGYNNSWNGINYGVNYADGNTMFNVGTTFKNGGLASIL